MKVAFACPSYGPMEPIAVASQRSAIMTAWTHGIEVRSDVFVDRVAWEGSRNIIVNAFRMLDDTFDGIFWADSDQVLPQNAIVDTVGPQQDIVTGVYYGRHPPYEPKIFAYGEKTDSYFHIVNWPDANGSLFPVHACGFGCVYTSRRALELTTQVRDKPVLINHQTGEIRNDKETFWFKFGRYSEDLSWCHKAREMGLTIWCNPNVVVGHLGEVSVIGPRNREDYVKQNPDAVGVNFVPEKKKEDEQSESVPEPEKTPGNHHSLVLQEDMRMFPSA